MEASCHIFTIPTGNKRGKGIDLAETIEARYMENLLMGYKTSEWTYFSLETFLSLGWF